MSWTAPSGVRPSAWGWGGWVGGAGARGGAVSCVWGRRDKQLGPGLCRGWAWARPPPASQGGGRRPPTEQRSGRSATACFRCRHAPSERARRHTQASGKNQGMRGKGQQQRARLHYLQELLLLGLHHRARADLAAEGQRGDGVRGHLARQARRPRSAGGRGVERRRRGRPEARPPSGSAADQPGFAAAGPAADFELRSQPTRLRFIRGSNRPRAQMPRNPTTPAPTPPP